MSDPERKDRPAEDTRRFTEADKTALVKDGAVILIVKRGSTEDQIRDTNYKLEMVNVRLKSLPPLEETEIAVYPKRRLFVQGSLNAGLEESGRAIEEHNKQLRRRLNLESAGVAIPFNAASIAGAIVSYFDKTNTRLPQSLIAFRTKHAIVGGDNSDYAIVSPYFDTVYVSGFNDKCLKASSNLPIATMNLITPK